MPGPQTQIHAGDGPVSSFHQQHLHAGRARQPRPQRKTTTGIFPTKNVKHIIVMPLAASMRHPYFQTPS